MPFSVCPYRHFPVRYAVTYHGGLVGNQGIVWNLSMNGSRLSAMICPYDHACAVE